MSSRGQVSGRGDDVAAQDHGLEDWSNYPNPRKDDLLTPDDSEIEVVPDEAREVWTKEKPSGYTREDYERDKTARERRQK